ncbi:hypothetical protein P43SY_007031 [Pythium insidiosum]|uniref:Uncharacterized protein n=1 Tax=Pythium insidiosum TaxID=114742 RepID=A0AAD5M876_PYTIN|nr:hypothetical protein P43SY_007031 [Pythium insidiosum]
MVPPKEPKEAAIAIKGLAPSVTDAMLRQLYGICGRVLRVKMDGLGGAHVVFSSGRSAERAVKATQATVLEGQTIDVQVVRQFSSSNRPCRGFQEGICRKGDACKYLHVGDAPSAAATTTPTVKVTAPPTVKAAKPVPSVAPATPAAQTAATVDPSTIPPSSICRFFARGLCTNGTACRFAHVLGIPPPPPPPSSIPAPCSFFAVGRCTRGQQCQFLHGPVPEASEAQAAPVQTKPAPVESKPAPKPAKPAKAAAEATTQKAKKQKTPPAVAEPVILPTAASDDRVCIECEQPGAATLRCDACDGVLYCEECDAMVHRPKVMRSHERSTLPPVVVKAPRPLCNECETEEAVSQCGDCDTTYCAACDASVHRFKSLRNHQRTPIEEEVVTAAPSQPTQERAAATASKKKTQTLVEVAAPSKSVTKTANAYVDSVPQYDLPSESESSDDEADDGAAAAMMTVGRAVVHQPSAESSSEEEEEEEDEGESVIAPSTTPVTAYVESVPKYDLSSESEDDDDSDDDEDDAPTPVSKPTAADAAKKLPPPVSPTKLYVRLPANVSSESSEDDDFDDERPVVPRPTVEKKSTLPSLDVSSESSSDEEDERPQTAPAAARSVAAANKRKACSSSSSSSDSDDDETPAVKQPRREEPSKRATKSTPASSSHSHAKSGGISEGNTHSVVKKIEAYAGSDRTDVLHLDANLNGFERLLAHDCAERLGLRHVSVGEGVERHITISRHDGDKRASLKRAAAAADAAGKPKKAKTTSK